VTLARYYPPLNITRVNYNLTVLLYRLLYSARGRRAQPYARRETRTDPAKRVPGNPPSLGGVPLDVGLVLPPPRLSSKLNFFSLSVVWFFLSLLVFGYLQFGVRCPVH
jgi:hypothetical protein